MHSVKYAILGGGMVAGYAAKQYVENGGRKGDLAIISSDDALPYERPPLSKSFLAGKDTESSILISQEDFYRDNSIEVRLNTHVQAVDFESKLLKIAGSEDLKYEKLVIATGASPRKLDCPGNDLAGLFYLRSMDDSRRIRDAAASAKKAVVVGGGFIGMEVASVLAQKGVDTTLIFPDDRIWKNFFSPELSALFRGYYEQRGVHFVTGASIVALKGNSSVETAVTSIGASLDCNIVVAGIGVTPVTDIFKGIALGNGIVVNDHLEASASGVHAAGDVANYADGLWHKQRRVEHWDNAVSQGQYVARALLG
ncbi:MAG TPA: NAD(P)/FAD-dependent oxidoreductase [Bryobacteraceae bacterium]|nr:NAD(P)/FAD-dependent oxidoreductase [Bryobacteraceae bacterium]